MQTKEFQIKNVLCKIDAKKVNAQKGTLPTTPDGDYNIPARTATTQNQGLSCYVRREDATVLCNAISVSANGDYCAFYHDSDFAILQDSFAVTTSKVQLTRGIALYLIGCMKRSLVNFGWANKSSWSKIKEQFIALPVKIVIKPDFALMAEIGGGC